MGRKINPCKDCTERKQGCHSQCEKYKEWKTAHEEENKIIAEARKQQWAIANYEFNKASVRKLKK